MIEGEWPSGWIGWLVTSVSVTGSLGFLLVHPLRTSPHETWIRTYTRWLFVGLIPAAVMLLVALGKRIAPYGLTESRALAVALGVWLLGIGILYTIRSGASIRIIPISLAALLLGTLYGPVSLTRLSVASQGRRLARLLAVQPPTDATVAEASAALRFLLQRRADDEIAARIGRPLPAIDWDVASRHGEHRDSLARRIMELAGLQYSGAAVGRSGQRWFTLGSREPVAVAGFDWMLAVAATETATRVVGGDTVRVLAPSPDGLVRGWILLAKPPGAPTAGGRRPRAAALCCRPSS